MTIQEKIARIEQNIANHLPQAEQQKLVEIFKAQISSKLDECAEYYGNGDSPMGQVYAINNAKAAFEGTETQGLYQLYTAAYDVDSFYALPFHCKDVFPAAFDAIKSKIGNLVYSYEGSCTAPSELYCTLGDAMKDAFGSEWINS